MYIKNLIYENVGPIEHVNIKPSYTSYGNPKPLLLVGENGTGKSTILSNIVDSFYEIAGEAFDNACQPINSGHQYYKIIRPSDIHIGKKDMFSYIQFEDDGIENLYLCKSGSLSMENIKEKIGNTSLKNLSWELETNYKGITFNKQEVENIFSKNIMCYFGPDRYEKPAWLGDRYYNTTETVHMAFSQSWFGQLKNDITVKNVTETNLQWLLDVIADSRSDIAINEDISLTHVKLEELHMLGQARKNLEIIMSKILGTNVYFSLNFRNAGGSRFKIIKESDNSIVANSLDSLSTGQLALFNTFASIIRYADNNNINQSIYLDQITGIVVIDEIELHLHTNLQKEILPELIQLFPKIQFIITTHAPLFLLGMSETFGEDNFDIYEMPTACKITVERFSEFLKAFQYLQETQKYQREIYEAIEQINSPNNVLIITEGSTDWKHMKAAYNELKNDSRYYKIFKDLNFSFLEYEPKNSTDIAEYKLEMGCSQLVSFCQDYSKLPQTTKFICIADRDDAKTNKALSTTDAEFKTWGNNVYSFILPLPKTREQTPEICIEHLYSDKEIKTTYISPNTKTEKRLYIGNEFDDYGFSYDRTTFCQKTSFCGSESIKIIDGSDKKHVIKSDDKSNTNIALSKSKFASLILSKTAPFDHFNFDNFVPIFETIKHILESDS